MALFEKSVLQDSRGNFIEIKDNRDPYFIVDVNYVFAHIFDPSIRNIYYIDQRTNQPMTDFDYGLTKYFEWTNFLFGAEYEPIHQVDWLDLIYVICMFKSRAGNFEHNIMIVKDIFDATDDELRRKFRTADRISCVVEYLTGFNAVEYRDTYRAPKGLEKFTAIGLYVTYRMFLMDIDELGLSEIYPFLCPSRIIREGYKKYKDVYLSHGLPIVNLLNFSKFADSFADTQRRLGLPLGILDWIDDPLKAMNFLIVSFYHQGKYGNLDLMSIRKIPGEILPGDEINPSNRSTLEFVKL